MLKQFISHLSTLGIVPKEQSVLLAVSGGLDSMVMLHLFQAAGISCGVAHCNFQLRGSDSNEDEAFVQQACATSGIPFHVQRFDTANYAESKGLSIQLAARELRYSWFKELSASFGYAYIATAHHLNDSMETALLNWAHGAFGEGKHNIPQVNNSIIRPLLFATRQQIEVYAMAQSIVWREDKSNASDAYTRNFIRHHIVPKFKEINPSLESTYQRGLRKAQGEQAFFEKAFEQWKQTAQRSKNGQVYINKNAFDGIRPMSSLLYKLLAEYDFNFDVCEEIERAMHGQAGKQFLSATHVLVIDREEIILTAQIPQAESVYIAAGQATAKLGNNQLEIVSTHSLKPLADSRIARIDISQVIFPLTWRTWKEGDYFYPLGMDHKKKLSDFLIDQKIPRSEKNAVTVLESAGQIIWVVGQRIDNRFKLTDNTREALELRLQTHFS